MRDAAKTTDRPDDIVGHKTLLDGTQEPLRRDEAKAIWAQVRASDKRRRRLMPDALSALDMLGDARQRLRDEGWADGIYCPKDGSEFAVIEYGSTGIFAGFYCGKWPDGHVICCDFVGHPKGILWKPLSELTEPERARLERCMDAERQMREAELRRLGAVTTNRIRDALDPEAWG